MRIDQHVFLGQKSGRKCQRLWNRFFGRLLLL